MNAGRYAVALDQADEQADHDNGNGADDVVPEDGNVPVLAAQATEAVPGDRFKERHSRCERHRSPQDEHPEGRAVEEISDAEN